MNTEFILEERMAEQKALKRREFLKEENEKVAEISDPSERAAAKMMMILDRSEEVGPENFWKSECNRPHTDR